MLFCVMRWIVRKSKQYITSASTNKIDLAQKEENSNKANKANKDKAPGKDGNAKWSLEVRGVFIRITKISKQTGESESELNF